MKNLGIIGFGNMGEALVRGVQAGNSEVRVLVSEKVEERRKLAVETYGAADLTGDYATIFKEADVVILAIKPQDLAELGPELKPHAKDRPVISILAGKTIQFIRDNTDAYPIARFMPSLAASVRKSVVGVSYSPQAPEKFREESYRIAETLGVAVEVPERLMPAIIGTSGSGIAFAFQYLHAMALGGTKVGIPYDSSLEIAMDVMEGAIALVRETQEQPVPLITKVCSPAGTTIEGISALETHGFTPALIAAVEAAAIRSTQLEQ